jgi:iron(III) transport system permease protein
VSTAALLPVIGLLLVIFWMGFWQNGPGEPVVYTLNHYRNILTDSFTLKTLLNTLGFASTTVAISLFFAIPIAWLVERTDLPGKEFVFTLMAVGALVPTFFTAMGWVFLLHPRIGVVNRIFVDVFGLAQGPFNIASIIGMGWVEGLGLSSLAFIMIVATYRSMDPSLEEVGRVHGLRLFQTLRHITLPLTFPAFWRRPFMFSPSGFRPSKSRRSSACRTRFLPSRLLSSTKCSPWKNCLITASPER